MPLKNQTKKKDERFAFRCTTEEKNKMQAKANLYTDGDLSAWLIYTASNYVPSGNELEDEPKKKKGKK